ncbi:MAG TPA: hypothetical protein VMW82_02675 [Candidatus Paceibacterota bacterium]|nr:hypothetical protein [Candidatus Paceibacterota bacterium]
MYRYKISWIISPFILAGLVYVLFFSSIGESLFKKKPEIRDEQEIGIICKDNTGSCFYFNKDGIIFKDAPQTSGSLILLIKDYSQKDYKLGDKVLDKSFLDILLQAKDELFSKMGLMVASFDIELFPIEVLRVVTNESWYILFSLKRDIKSQLLALKVALDEKIENRMSLRYIDLRIENRIYYK